MANSITYNTTSFKVGDMVNMTYKLKEKEKERTQAFKGILIKIKGNTPSTKMITIRRLSKSGIGVERIIPLASPNLVDIKLVKKSSFQKAKLYFIRNLTESEQRRKLFSKK